MRNEEPVSGEKSEERKEKRNGRFLFREQKSTIIPHSSLLFLVFKRKLAFLIIKQSLYIASVHKDNKKTDNKGKNERERIFSLVSCVDSRGVCEGGYYGSE